MSRWPWRPTRYEVPNGSSRQGTPNYMQHDLPKSTFDFDLMSIFEVDLKFVSPKFKPESNKRWKTGPGHVCLYVGMFFKDISRSRALSESKVVSCCSPVNSTLHRHDIIRVRFLTSVHHLKIGKIDFLKMPSRKCMWILAAAYFQFVRQA